MRHRLLLTIAFCFFFLPVAHAQESVVWDLQSGGPMPSSAFQIAQTEQTPMGLRVVTTQDGALSWMTRFQKDVSVLTLHTTSTNNMRSGILWLSPAGEQLQMNFWIPAGQQTTRVALKKSDGWNSKTEQIGIGFQGGADVYIQKITWTHLSTWEKALEAVKSFWTFDTQKIYSINFLWGPLISFEPASRATLYDNQPPPSWSALRVFYAVLLISIVVAWIRSSHSRTAQGRRNAMMSAVWIFVALWLLFDVRMSAELLSYAKNDYTQFASKDWQEKTFRNYKQIHSLFHDIIPHLAPYESYVVLQPKDTPYFSNLRYMTYPSVARLPSAEMQQERAWLVIDRLDIAVDANGTLTDKQGTVFATSGSILQRFDPHTFLFVTRE